MNEENGSKVAGAVNECASDARIARLVATIAGLLGFVAAVAVPLLPVTQTTACLLYTSDAADEVRRV